MSQHPSLKTSSSGKKHRTVIKRYERLLALKEKGILKDEDSVFGMPKLKIIKIKVKKEKAEEKPKEGEALPATPAAATESSAKKDTAVKGGKEAKK